jgi:hypothetical protein
MAEAGSSTDLEINPDNYEDRNVYNSICEYLRVASNQVVTTIRHIGICPKNSRDIVKPKRIKVSTPQEVWTPKQVEVTEKNPVNMDTYMDTVPSLERAGTVVIKEEEKEPRIKKISSRSFSKSLGSKSDTIQITNIKELNRQISLEVQNLNETLDRIVQIKRLERTESGGSLSDEDEQKIKNELTTNQIVISGRVTTVNKPNFSYPQELNNCKFINAENVLNYIDYGCRNLVVLPIPDDSTRAQIIFNSQGKWCPNGGVGPGYPTSKFCPFYKSTGHSNETNFPDMWFPFFRIKTSIPGQNKSIATQERGWIYKAWGLQSVTQLRTRLRERLKKAIPSLSEEKEPLTSDFLYCFLEKFSHWWQIQLSLQLPVKEGTLWETSPILQELKNIVENYDYDHFGGKNCFIPRGENKIRQLYLLSEPACRTLEKSKVALINDNTIAIDYTPDYINMWLRGGPGGTNTLCVEDGDDH